MKNKKKIGKKSKSVIWLTLLGIFFVITLIIPVVAVTNKQGKSTKNSSEIVLENENITFTIGEKSYQGNVEMTWEEWIESEYNTDNYYIDNENYICNDIGKLTRNENYVLKNYYVINNANYIVDSSGGQGLTDLAGTYWFLSQPLSGVATFEIDFADNYGNEYNELTTNVSGNPMSWKMYYDDTAVYYESEDWTGDGYRKIHITGGVDVTNSTLIELLQEEATQITAEEFAILVGGDN